MALARATYQDRDVYLMDDPFAAVDAMVAHQLLHHAVLGQLVQRGKTVVLCTHQVQFASHATHVLLVDKGTVRSIGSEEAVAFFASSLRPTPATGKPNKVQEEKEANEEAIDSTETETTAPIETAQPSTTTTTSLTVEETRGRGYINGAVILRYLRAVQSPLLLFATFSSLTLMQASKNVSDWWLSYWVDSTAPGALDARDIWFYLGLYMGIAFLNTLFTLAR